MEQTMRNGVCALALAVAMAGLCLVGGADAQSNDPRGPTDVGPGSPVTESQPKGVLSQTERNRIRRAVEQSTVLEKGPISDPAIPAVVDRQVVIGKPLPPTLPARLAPASLIDAMPPRTGHEYWVFANNIALIDGESRYVVDIVRDVF